MSSTGSIDFGYPWWLSYGHLVILIPALGMLVLSIAHKWARWRQVSFALITLWAGAAALAIALFGINRVPALPTEAFMASGTGRVLDIGAGTGRSSIMVLRSRPRTTLVASDLFGKSFEQHFGKGPTPQERLSANLRKAGVADRASIETADMLKLPFESASFDGIVSAYAVDHLNRDGSRQALREAHRVLKTGGDFLLILIENDRWAKFAFGPLLAHGGTRGATWWRDQSIEAGFQVVEQGTEPVTLFLLLRRP
ncbi:MAG: class I SAM-dependent methyltransferase [Vicinamibacterales bacterium]